MKKVLILAYDFPPFISMGAQRPWSWFIYFKTFGYYPIVITRHWDENIKTSIDTLRLSTKQEKTIEKNDYGTIIKVPFKPGFRDRLIIRFGEKKYGFFRKVLSFFGSYLQYTSLAFDGKSNIFLGANAYLKNNKVDLIIASGGPFVLFRYASILSRKFKTPWVADYRDCWSNLNQLIDSKPKAMTHWDLFALGYFERKFVKNAAYITCPGKIYHKKIKEIFPEKAIKIIYNGFFEEEKVFQVKPLNHSKEIKIAFGGTMYPFQPISVFLKGLKELIGRSEGTPPLKVFFYGGLFNNLQVELIKQDIELLDYFVITDRIPRKELLMNYSKVDLLLLFSNRGMISGKLFDYFLVGKPILFVGSDDGEMEEIIRQYSLGFICKDYMEVADFLQSYIEGKDQENKFLFDISNMTFFSRKNQAEILCKHFDDFLT